MKLIVDNSKVVKLRPKKLGVVKCLKDALDNAHEADAVIVIEVRKKEYKNYLSVSHSSIRADTLVYAMMKALKEIEKISGLV